jgi:hypothetical protein
LIADDGHSQLLVSQEVKMNYFDMNLEVHSLRAEEERILACFTRCLLEIAAVAEARGSATSPIAALNAMALPAIALDQNGFVAYVNTAAETVFDDDVKIKNRCLFVRDPEARARLNEAVDQLKTSPFGCRADHRSTPGQIACHYARLVVRRGGELPGAGRARGFDVECPGA